MEKAESMAGVRGSAKTTMKDLTGMTFGRLKVLSLHSRGTKTLRVKWNCSCVCGNPAIVPANNLTTRQTKSCRCLKLESLKLGKRFLATHGMSKSGAYGTWYKMVNRCTNPKADDFKFYMARGITVCDFWLKFENFYRDMGDRPEGMEIDRIDNNKGYYKENCRWVSHKENCRNFRRNRMVTYQGQTKTLIEWSEDIGLNESSVRHRLNNGWSIEKALTAPKNSTRSEAATRGNLRRYGSISS